MGPRELVLSPTSELKRAVYRRADAAGLAGVAGLRLTNSPSWCDTAVRRAIGRPDSDPRDRSMQLHGTS